MSEAEKLTEEQEQRIQVTLTRIRNGLHRKQPNQFEEPAHLFVVEAFDASQKG